MIRNENYVTVQGWMVKELGLKGNELLIYAIIYGFSQTDSQMFTGSMAYLAEWTNSTKRGVIKNLKSLVEKGLLGRKEVIINNVKFVHYYVTKFTGVVNKVHGGGEQSSPYNIEDNIDILNDNDNSAREYEKYNLCEKYIGRPLSVSEINLIKEWTIPNELIQEAIRKAEINNVFAMSYINKIIQRWQDKGIETVREAEIEQQRFENSRKHREKEPKKSDETEDKERAERERYIAEREKAEIEEFLASFGDLEK